MFGWSKWYRYLYKSVMCFLTCATWTVALIIEDYWTSITPLGLRSWRPNPQYWTRLWWASCPIQTHVSVVQPNRLGAQEKKFLTYFEFNRKFWKWAWFICKAHEPIDRVLCKLPNTLCEVGMLTSVECDICWMCLDP